MAWGSKTSATQLTSITNTEQFFDQLVTLNPGETAHVQIDFNPVATPTDNLTVSVYTTLDDASPNWDDSPYAVFNLSKSPDPNAASFTVTGIYRFRVGVKATGATDTHTSCDMAYRVDGIAL